MRLDPRLLSFNVTNCLIILLGLYYLTDTLRLYLIIDQNPVSEIFQGIESLF
ncbi:MAG: hypothetical protein ACMUHX_03585 [bacterium]